MKPNERYLKLEQHLAEENPVLLDIIKIYKELDEVGYKTGLLPKYQTYASDISWWPLISVLGTFSAGKSSFINQYVSRAVQQSGNQAVDDKFTVICYGAGSEVNTLPGLALDADPRFPFFGISAEINKVDQGEGNKIDTYLQLKTVPEEILKGKILIDSPGFDADSQRDSTLKITKHIVDMSDLVLVFFDARHPEPGAMRDTLEHLVKANIDRNDAQKVMFILNQIDTAAQEDNPEEVIAAWQRALSQQGIIGGNFYAIYNEKLANEIPDEALAERFKRKKDIDLASIIQRMDKVSTDRAYRIADTAQQLAETLENEKIPALQKAISSWRNKVILLDVVILGSIFAGIGWGAFTYANITKNIQGWAAESVINGSVLAVITLSVIYFIHYSLRKKIVRWDAKRLVKTQPEVAHALLYNNRFWRGMFGSNPRGWSNRTKNKLVSVKQSSKKAIQKLTDQFADPSG